jgi:hypothetical protein
LAIEISIALLALACWLACRVQPIGPIIKDKQAN